ncbi:MAG: tetratricopeptide repeat protein [Proteobacteria bacterium]|nr:tetratricopeptide repeat protein [Pseudomonadota bacterium]
MTDKKNFFDKLINRRVPHVIGMYIAAVWLAVEIADWMSSRFAVSEQISSYVFVGMLVFLPSIVMITWGHGRPGKDSWSKTEITLIPLNILIAAFVVNLVVKPMAVATEMRSVVDVSSGSTMMFEVPKEGYNQTVLSLFWENETNDKSLDWLSYGANWLMTQDLKRTPILSVDTPYDSRSLLDRLVSKGFTQALNVPLALALQIASEQSADWVITGAFRKTGENIAFSAKVYDVLSGNQVKEITVEHENWLTALDQISDEVSGLILKATKVSKNIIPDLAISEHTSKNIEAIELLISAKNHIAFDNDFQAGIDDLLTALDVDASFAEANVLAMSYYRGLGDFEEAIAHSKKALALDYKIYQESVFLVKANLFAMNGDPNKAIKVLENWTKVYPESVKALETLGSNYFYLGDHLEEAKAVYQKLYRLEGGSHDALTKLGSIYRLQENKEQAIDALQKHLEANPTKADAYIKLADTYKQFGMFEQAKNMYEEAAFIANNGFDAEIGLAYINAYQGEHELALSQLDKLLDQTEADLQKIELLTVKITIYYYTGQINKALDTLNRAQEPADKVFDPLRKLFQISGGKINLLASLGEYDQALTYVEQLMADTKPPFNQMSSLFLLGIYGGMNETEKYQQTLGEIELFLEEFPMPTVNPSIFAAKGKISHKNGDFKAAIDYFDTAIKESKTSFVSLFSSQEVDEYIYEKAKVLMDMELYDEAMDDLNALLDRNPLFIKALSLKAEVHYLQEDIDEAIVVIEQVNRLWQLADQNFVDYKAFKQFESRINLTF